LPSESASWLVGQEGGRPGKRRPLQCKRREIEGKSDLDEPMGWSPGLRAVEYLLSFSMDTRGNLSTVRGFAERAGGKVRWQEVRRKKISRAGFVARRTNTRDGGIRKRTGPLCNFEKDDVTGFHVVQE